MTKGDLIPVLPPLEPAPLPHVEPVYDKHVEPTPIPHTEPVPIAHVEPTGLPHFTFDITDYFWKY